MGTEHAVDPADDPIAGIAADHPGAVVARWVTVAEVIDTDGSQFLSLRVSPGLAPWDTIGLLSHSLAVEQAAVTDGFLRREDED